jgi:hypothetical protein
MSNGARGELMDDRCILCQKAFGAGGRVPSLEHIVPISLGGEKWLRTRLVCRSCNNRMGREVDRLADIPLFLALRDEAGLAPSRAMRVVYLDERTGLLMHGTRASGGLVVPDERRYQQGEKLTVVGHTEARAQAIADKHVQRASKRDEKVAYGAAYTEPAGPVLVMLNQDDTRVDELEVLLVREAAKIAVEYVAYLAGGEAALDQALDPLRQVALEGSGDGIEGWGLDHKGKCRMVYLPRIKLHFASSRDTASTAPSYDEQVKLLLGPDGRAVEIHPDASPLTRVYHRLCIWREGADGRFEVTLFGWFGIRFTLPANPPLPWGRCDYWDFTRRRHGTLISRH